MWIVKPVGQRVHPHVEVGDVHAHGLLAHSRLTQTEICLIMGSVTRIIMWIVGHVGQRVHLHMEVGDVHAHGLLTHSGLTQKYVLLWVQKLRQQ
jgi:hypothetical protein